MVAEVVERKIEALPRRGGWGVLTMARSFVDLTICQRITKPVKLVVSQYCIAL